MLNDNKLASDEMERLLAEALSSRNRELEMLSMNNNENTSKTAEEWISGSSDNVTNTNANNIKRPIQKNINTNNVIQQKKNVSFNDNENEEIIYDKDTNHIQSENSINNKKIDEFDSRIYPDYAISDVSDTVVKIIQSYTHYINKKTWFKL